VEELDSQPVASPPDPPATSPGGPSGLRWLVVVVAVAALAAIFYPRGGTGRVRGPGGFLAAADGKPISLESRLAPVTLVHFWASWCPPCQAELPQIVRFARETDSAQFKVLFVAVADEPQTARSFFAADDLELFYDPTWDVAHRFGTDALPETHVVVGGKIVRSFVGAADWDDPGLRAELQKWTATPTSAAP